MLKFFELFVKVTAYFLKNFFKSGGETWPGEIVLRIYPSITKHLAKYFTKIIFIVGTNGKTSTTKLLKEVLKEAGYDVISNPSGANLLNGVVGNILLQKKFFKDKGYVGVFEIDEYSLARIAGELVPSVVIILNLLRDQLDRYGEVGSILSKWRASLAKLSNVHIIANASDPGIYTLCQTFDNAQFFGIPDAYLHNRSTSVFGDYVYCPNCNYKFSYEKRYIAHIGKWQCSKCGLRPRSYFVFDETKLKKLRNLPDYLVINSQAVYLLCKAFSLDTKIVFSKLKAWQPAYGRGEKRIIGDKTFVFYLGKNPSGWTVALENALKKHKDSRVFLFGLNNRIPDGRDVSWIWDINVSSLVKYKTATIFTFGDRGYDMALRLEVEGIKVNKTLATINDLKKELKKYRSTTIIVLANYSALLEVRKALLGRAIL